MSSANHGGQNVWGRGRGRRGGGGGGRVRGRRGGSTATPFNATAEPSQATLARVAAIGQNREKLIAAMSDSGSEDEEGERESEGARLRELLSNTLKMYYRDLGGAENEDIELSDTRSMLMASGSCLICLSAVRRTEPTWSCLQCFCLFHLQCIQQWARDGVKQLSLLSPELFPGRELTWSCPKCRHDYRQAEFPEKYVCFCGKAVDPPVDPWILPHSCGQICNKPLQCGCGHTCVALCHPGFCPPCPKTVSVSCFCGRSSPVVQRCGARGWSCGEVCSKVLSCDLHTCEMPCHEGSCPPCDQEMEQPCECGKECVPRRCGGEVWHCQQLCGREFSCGHHHCQKVCHAGLCGECPLSGSRTCPCGKTEHLLPCTSEVPTCGDTCGKDLPCGHHQCMRPCHYGDCGQCFQVALQRCCCGDKEKSVPCSERFRCELRCQRKRQCTRHQCRRRCCDGSCPPCDQVCGKMLGCRKHKCAAPCHAGRCYPCVQTEEVSCPCGSTKKSVPCGGERSSEPPVCWVGCRKAPTCHHSQRKPHACHSGSCPPCQFRCTKTLSCGHSCTTACHSEPKLPERVRPPGTAPWVKLPPASLTPVVLPCPPCKQPVSKACKGDHEVSVFPCSELKEFSCGRRCGRQLSCGNHACLRWCHVVSNPPDDKTAGEDCLLCESECLVPRPDGCTHLCPLPCHPGECPQCTVLVKLRCHCTTMNLYIKCSEWTVASVEKKAELQACNSQCTNMLPCSHRCPRQCHPSPCPSETDCRKRVGLRCPCGRIKRDARCNERMQKTPECDAECSRLRMEREEEKRCEAAAKREKEEREEREREEEVERLLRPRKRKRKRRIEEEEIPLSLYQKHRTAVLVALGVVVIGVLVTVALLVLQN